MHEALAVRESLIKRGMHVEGKCKRCGEMESIAHVMFLCPFAREVWSRCPSLFVPHIAAGQSIEESLKACSRMINFPPTGLRVPLYPWVMWALWTSRNQLCFEDKSFSETEVMGKAIKNALEWQNSQATKIPSTSSKDCPIKKAPTQSQIMKNAFSCYSDAAWNSNSYAGGLGWICFKPDGTKLFQGSSAHHVIASVLVAEALSLKAAINAAIAHGAKDLVCFSDSKILISLITGNMSVISLQGILHDIGVLSRSPSSISFKFVSRNGNVVADGLAKSALFSVSNSPSEIVNYVTS